MSARDTVYETLNTIAQIQDPIARKEELRRVMLENNVIAIVVQRVYHPEYTFDLPPGPLPDLAKKSNHDDKGPFLYNLKRWDKFRPASEVPENVHIRKHVREEQFLSLYESVSSGDADLLVAVKEKQLPWESLNLEFVLDAVPELFPDSFRPEIKQAAPKANTTTDKIESKKDLCSRIMQENPGLARKDYLKLFQDAGISKVTAGQYYQALKG